MNNCIGRNIHGNWFVFKSIKKAFAKREFYCLQKLHYVQSNNEQIHTVLLTASQSNEILFPLYSKNGYEVICQAEIIHMNKSEKSAN